MKFRSGVSGEPTKKGAAIESNAAAVTLSLETLDELRASASLTIETSFAKWKYDDFGLRRRGHKVKKDFPPPGFNDAPSLPLPAFPAVAQVLLNSIGR